MSNRKPPAQGLNRRFLSPLSCDRKGVFQLGSYQPKFMISHWLKSRYYTLERVFSKLLAKGQIYTENNTGVLFCQGQAPITKTFALEPQQPQQFVLLAYSNPLPWLLALYLSKHRQQIFYCDLAQTLTKLDNLA